MPSATPLEEAEPVDVLAEAVDEPVFADVEVGGAVGVAEDKAVMVVFAEATADVDSEIVVFVDADDETPLDENGRVLVDGGRPVVEF